MKPFTIITDSCCSLNADEVQELGITVVPLSFTIDGKTYIDARDNPEISLADFYERIAKGKECITSAVNCNQFSTIMQTELEKGKDILCICFSSALSCTYQNACMAAKDLQEEYPDSKIIVLDSFCACRGMGMLIYRTVTEQRKRNLDIEETAKFVRLERHHQAHWFFVDDLNHLHRGGRVSKLVAVAGSVLNIKPIMHCDVNGKLVATGKARGANGAIRALVDKMKETGILSDRNQTVFICHSNCPQYVQKISKILGEEFGITDIRADYCCPVIGAHTGCGTLGVFFVAKNR